MNINTQTRNHGIDLLRIVSTLMIVTLHVLGAGGVLGASKGASTMHYGTFWLLEIISYCAVNCYALISGYVGYAKTERRQGYHRYFGLWLQVFFYSAIFWIVGRITMPELISVKDVIKGFLPVTFEQYWYFTAYTGVFVLQPWLNRLVRQADLRQMKKIFTLILLFSCYYTVVSYVADPFDVSYGYSVLWLCILYIVGAWLKKSEVAEKINLRMAVGCGVLFILITWATKIVMPIITEKLSGNSFGGGILVSYVSPTIVGFSVVLLIIFSKFTISKQWIIRLISFVAPTTFGIYLVHTHPWVYTKLLTKAFSWVAAEPLVKAVAFVLLVVMGIFLSCMLVERVRILLFRICKISKLCYALEEFLWSKWEHIMNKKNQTE